MSYIGLPIIPVVAQRIKKGIITAPSNIIIVQGGYVYNQIAIYINGARIFTGYTANDGVNIVFDETLPSGTEWAVEELFNAGKSIIQATEEETLDGVEGVFPDAKDVKGILDSRIKQTTGTSTTDVMSQKAVTDNLFGVGQSGANVTALRTHGVTYTNTTKKARVVEISGFNEGNALAEILRDGVRAGQFGFVSSGYPPSTTISIVIPPGSTYRLTRALSSMYWSEL